MSKYVSSVFSMSSSLRHPHTLRQTDPVSVVQCCYKVYSPFKGELIEKQPNAEAAEMACLSICVDAVLRCVFLDKLYSNKAAAMEKQ